MGISKIDSTLTMKFFLKSKESLYYDRKRAKVSCQDLANEIASFANANGGIIAIGITDDSIIEGFEPYGEDKLNDLQKVVSNYLKPAPIYKSELIKVKNQNGNDDNILVFHIEPVMNYVVRNNKDEVYCRQGDSSIKLTSDQVKSLEYDRRERDFENEILIDTSIEDIDVDMVRIYKEKLGTDISDEQILRARGFLKEKQGELHLTKAGMLLFGKNPTIYLPSARVRVVKFSGNEFKLGTQLNIIKDRTFDQCLYKTIEKSREFINTQLREFTHLNDNGIFETVPEYPEFAWYEGLVNAVTHRDYTNSGEFITIKIFDNRLEIYSPGKLGGFVTLDTMTTKRYSRNPQIARTLTELGIVRELNEGVKRIYSEMQRFFLNDPVYSEPDRNSLLLVLENNIIMRDKRAEENLLKNNKLNDNWNKLNQMEKKVILALYDKGEMTSTEVARVIDRSKPTAVRILNKLIELKLVEWMGTSKFDYKGKYIIKI